MPALEHKIAKPGVYDIPIEEYHGDVCIGPSVSSTALWRIINECPALYWETSPLNPNRVPQESTRAFDVGRAGHALVLGEPEFNRHFAILPFDSLRTNEAKAWKTKVESEGKTVLRAEDFDAVRAMADAQRRSPQVARAFRDGKPEVSLIWQDEETGIWMKSRPDYLADDPAASFTIEYKTVRTAEPRELAQNFFRYGYHLQAAVQREAIRIVLGAEPMGIAHVVQEKTSPFLAELRLLTPEQIDFGHREFRRALRLFRRCWDAWKAGKPDRIAWPGYTTEPTYIETPYHIAKQMMESETNAPEADRRGNQTRDPADYLSA